ncbi:cold shock domain-containing protein [Streptomyces sp. So13.3]|uniref:cold shock domain-containing protein n=1 Tax=Streptomyces TaxID=1883 RepID=UPI0011063C99|nr:MULTISPECIES: cold shock domain-containing protein [Streptomyces]MCZ4102563.1 cold shock domain-containing protein [Streptomyces sp. H39-C1]QNA77559.1 cold shock domain-containing protein [Streptomyces sp. So13.3]
MSSRTIGFVQWFNRDAGYGFVIPIGGNDPVYFEEQDIEGPCSGLSEDQQISFVLELTATRFVARQIRT